jgi:hypothetical protein
MKLNMRQFVMLAITLVTCVGSFGCSGLHQISADKFVAKMNTPPDVGSVQVHRVSYIGASGSRAYLEEWDMGLFYSSTDVLWTPLSELPEDVVAKLRSPAPEPTFEIVPPTPPPAVSTRPLHLKTDR